MTCGYSINGSEPELTNTAPQDLILWGNSGQNIFILIIYKFQYTCSYIIIESFLNYKIYLIIKLEQFKNLATNIFH